MADKGPDKAAYDGEKTLTEDSRKIVEETELEAVNASFANIMQNHKPNPWGKGHLQLYALAVICFLNSTMSGKSMQLWACLDEPGSYLQVLMDHSWVQCT